jgi:hypothetical protein
VPEVGAAGTLDRAVYLPDGRVRILDLKTGKDLSYGWLEIAIQQALYANARCAWNPAKGQFDPMPEGLDQRIGYVLHLPVGKADAQLYEVNLVEGWRLAQIAFDVKTARSKSKDLARVVPTETPDDVLKQITHADSQQVLAQLWDTYHPRGLWTSEVNAYAQGRLRQLTQV